ncbi:hypothetical protein J4207_05490 [Candidatus Woesearchaeota archaeon]|nr:hypothetical protein [Candidatus Woesearchaeota archaeon]
MGMDLMNSYVAKILIAARPEDSINSIAKRIDLSYGWTYKWIQDMIEEGIFKWQKHKIAVQSNHHFYRQTIDYIKQAFASEVGFYYSVLQLFGITYCFGKTDAVFVWTKGGYNIGRSKEYYPVFVTIKTADRFLFEQYCKKLDLQINAQSGVFYIVEFLDEFPREFCDGIPTEPIDETIAFMKKYIYNFQPALEMISEMYDKKLNIQYKEAVYD